MFLTLYVDDILLGRNNLEVIEGTRKCLSSIFEMKDIGDARYVLGMKIIKNCPKNLFAIFVLNL